MLSCCARFSSFQALSDRLRDSEHRHHEGKRSRHSSLDLAAKAGVEAEAGDFQGRADLDKTIARQT